MLRKIQKTMANDILTRTPNAQRSLKILEKRNKALAKLVVRGVPWLYHRYKTHEAASKGITKMIGRAFIANAALKELKVKKIDPKFVDRVIHSRDLTLSQMRLVTKKLNELERISRQRAEFTRERIQGFLALSVEDALKFIDGQIEAAKRNHGGK
jgi:hypothetical protein